MGKMAGAGPLAPDDPAEIGPYRLLGRLGAGPTGQSYLGRSAAGQVVAVKLLSEPAAHTPEFRDRLRAGVAAARGLAGDRRLVPVADADPDAAAPWLATEYVEAPSLAGLVTEAGPQPLDTVRELGTGLAEALAVVHAAGLTHGALKPSGVLVTGDGPRLLDLGLPGEPGTAASDVHALGAVLHFAVTGPDVPEGAQADLSAVADPALRALLADCLAASPTSRPTLTQLTHRLRLLDRPGTAVPDAGPAMPTLPATPPAPLTPPLPPTPPAGKPPAPKRRRTGPLVLAGVVCLALIGTAVVLLTRDADDGAPPETSATGEDAAVTPNGRLGFTWGLTGADAAAAAGGGDPALPPHYVGLWRTDDSVVLGTRHGLTAHDPANGEVLWSWDAPEDGFLCNMSRATSQDVGAFVYGSFSAGAGSQERCDRLQTIALETGDTGWDQPVALTAEGTTGFPNLLGGNALSIGNGVVSAPYAGSRTTSEGGTTDLITVDTETGRVRWSTDFGGEPTPEGCRLTGMAHVLNESVYTLAECEDEVAAQLVEFRSATEPGVTRVVGLSGCDPIRGDVLNGMLTGDTQHLLIGCDWYEDGMPALYSLAPYLESQPVRLDLEGVALSPLYAEFGGIDAPGNIVIHRDTLYLAKGEPLISGGESDGVVAIDLDGGQLLWDWTRDNATSVTLLSATEAAVDVVVSGEGGLPVLHAVTEDGPLTEGTRLTEEQAEALDSTPNAPLGTRAGERIAIGFPDAWGEDAPMLVTLPPAAPGQE